MSDRRLYDVSCVVTRWDSEPGFAIDYAQRTLGMPGMGRSYKAVLRTEKVLTLRGDEVLHALKDWARQNALLQGALEGREVVVRPSLSEEGQVEYSIEAIPREPSP